MGADESDCSSFEYTFLEETLVSAISKGMRKRQSQKGGRKKATRRRVIPALKGSFGETAGCRQNIYIIKTNFYNNQPKRFTSQVKII